MTDERIQGTVNRFAALGFFIWYVLTLISLNYRLLILKQHPRDFWDFIAIFCTCTVFVFISFARKGAFDYGFKRFWSTIFITIFIVNFVVLFLIGQIHSVVDVVEYLIGFLLGMVPVTGIAYFLNRRWKRKEGIEDEK